MTNENEPLEHQPRMELCPHCDKYNTVNDPPIPDIIVGTHECSHCTERFEMQATFRWLEAAKLTDRIEVIEREIRLLKGTATRDDMQNQES